MAIPVEVKMGMILTTIAWARRGERIEEIVGKHNREFSCCHRRCAHLQLVEGYGWEFTGALKQNITTQDNHEYEARFDSRVRVVSHLHANMSQASPTSSSQSISAVERRFNPSEFVMAEGLVTTHSA